MSGINSMIKSAFSEFKSDIENSIEQNCKTFCEALVKKAIQERESAKGKHNITGNLINSIVVCLYKKSKPVIAYYSSSSLPHPIARKMTTSHGKYTFDKTWDGKDDYEFKPQRDTDEGFGQEDAEEFFSSYRPNGNNMFDIVVAYPVEYADFIETTRGTAGFMRTLQYADEIGIKFLQIS